MLGGVLGGVGEGVGGGGGGGAGKLSASKLLLVSEWIDGGSIFERIFNSTQLEFGPTAMKCL